MIQVDRDLPDRRQGYARAETEDEALAMSGATIAIAQPGKLWPGGPEETFYWNM
ncbi:MULTISPECIES: hypothetical protein [unclassified Mameliella]|nr:MULTISPECIES: hypothetical protein [unclassified Mameliella]